MLYVENDEQYSYKWSTIVLLFFSYLHNRSCANGFWFKLKMVYLVLVLKLDHSLRNIGVNGPMYCMKDTNKVLYYYIVYLYILIYTR